MRYSAFRSVVCREDEDRVVSDAKFIDRAQQLGDVLIGLREHVSPVTVACPALVIRVRLDWQVRLRVGDEEKEMISVRRFPLTEGPRSLS